MGAGWALAGRGMESRRLRLCPASLSLPTDLRFSSPGRTLREGDLGTARSEGKSRALSHFFWEAAASLE